MNAIRIHHFTPMLTAALGGLIALPALGGGSKPLPEKVTFTEHVAPILFQNCARCHRPGEAAPFSLLTFDDARKRGRQIAEVTSRRFMPPWHAETGHLPFSNERILSEDDIAILGAWHKQGLTEGDASKLPPAPRFTEGWQLGKPDLVVEMPEPFEIPAEGPDIYWNFVLPLNLPADRYVTALEFRPGARTVVHHALYFLDTNGAARKFDERDPKPGYNGGPRSNRQFMSLGGWAVGGEALRLPSELAWTFPTNSDLVLQTHFHPSGKAEKEISRVGLYFSEKPPTRQFAMLQLPPAFGRISGLDIAAGNSNFVVKDSFVLPIDLEAFALSPHAHYLATTFHLTATPPGGKTQTLFKIPDWDFNWQEDVAYKNPVRLTKGTRLDATIVYNNSASNPRNPTHPPKRVKWGPMTTDEMAAMTLSVVPARDEDLKILAKEQRNHSIDLFIDRAQEDTRRREQVQAVAATFDKNGNGKIDDDERPALREFIQQSGLLKGL